MGKSSSLQIKLQNNQLHILKVIVHLVFSKSLGQYSSKTQKIVQRMWLFRPKNLDACCFFTNF